MLFDFHLVGENNTATKEQEHELFSEYIVERLISMLDGTHETFNMIPGDARPSKNQIVIGTLSEKETGDVQYSSITNFNSISVSFLCKESEEVRFKISPSFNLYYPAYPNLDDSIKIAESSDETVE